MDWKRYRTIRGSITTGDIYFTKATSIPARIVNFFTGSYVPHVGLFVVLGGRVFCVEINVFGRVTMYLASEFLRKRKIAHVKTNIPVDEYDILKDLGVIRYNSLGAILAPFMRLKTSRKDCVEWVAEKLRLQFPHLKRGLYPSDLLSVFADAVL
jgi:hypothetical protein